MSLEEDDSTEPRRDRIQRGHDVVGLAWPPAGEKFLQFWDSYSLIAARGETASASVHSPARSRVAACLPGIGWRRRGKVRNGTSPGPKCGRLSARGRSVRTGETFRVRSHRHGRGHVEKKRHAKQARVPFPSGEVSSFLHLSRFVSPMSLRQCAASNPRTMLAKGIGGIAGPRREPELRHERR